VSGGAPDLQSTVLYDMKACLRRFDLLVEPVPHAGGGAFLSVQTSRAAV
jgi:hypothetical protein